MRRRPAASKLIRGVQGSKLIRGVQADPRRPSGSAASSRLAASKAAHSLDATRVRAAPRVLALVDRDVGKDVEERLADGPAALGRRRDLEVLRWGAGFPIGVRCRFRGLADFSTTTALEGRPLSRDDRSRATTALDAPRRGRASKR